MTSTRILRDVPARPYAFAALDAEAPSPEIPSFVPLSDMTTWSVSRKGAPPESDSDPLPPAMAEAFERGREAGRADRDDEVTTLQAEIDRLTQAQTEAAEAAEVQVAFVRDAAERLHAHWSETVRALQPTLAALALDVAEAVLDAPLGDAQRAATDGAIATAVDALAGEAPLSVAVHPVDLLHLQESGLADTLSETHPTLRWEPDSTLAEGDWSVATPDAAVRRLRATMIATLRERLGLPVLS